MGFDQAAAGRRNGQNVKAHFKSATGRLLIELQADDVKGLFRAIAEVQEILDADSNCGACGSPAVRFRVRKVDKFEYFELACECGARLQFGQLQDGHGLFPKRRNERGEELPNRGWQRYLPERKK